MEHPDKAPGRMSVRQPPAVPQPPVITTGPNHPSTGPDRRGWRRRILRSVLALGVLFVLIQLVPFGRASNPPVTKAAAWPSPKAQALAQGACYDCHSNLSKRWWATKIAPASWLAQNDENGGRHALNFSEWDRPQAALDRVAEAVQSGSMPPLQYKLLHGSARLSSTERAQLVEGLRQLYAADPPPVRTRGGD
jgi:Haem-binding domain